MIIKTIRLQGFRSFTEEQTIHVQQTPGLTFIGGQNLVEPRLGSNGVGKSTIGEAIVWCLYNVSSGGLKAPTLRARECEVPMSVSVDIEVGDVPYTITRRHSPNALLVDDGGGSKSVEQSVVEDIIGVPLSVFTHSVFFGQNNVGYFIDMRSAEALTLLTDVLELDKWNKYADAAKQNFASAHNTANDLQRDIAVKRGALESLRDTIKRDKIRLDALRAKVSEEDTKSKKNLLKLQDELAEVSERRQDSEHVVEEATQAYNDMLTKLRGIQREQADNQTKLNSAVRQIKQLNATQQGIDDDLVKLQETGLCGTCGSKLKNDKAEELADGLRKSSQELSDKIQEVTEYLDTLEAEDAIYAKKVSKGTKRLSALRDELEHTRSDSQAVQKELMEVKAAIKAHNDVQDGAKLLEAEVQSIAEGIKVMIRQRDRTKAGLQELRAALDVELNNVDVFSFWSKEFRRIRFWVLEATLLELSVHTQNSLKALGLDDWRIDYTVTLESSRPTFKAEVIAPTIDEPLPWGSFSGGESQRLRIAAELAFCELVRTRCGFFPNLEFWDEPTNHLSADGVTDLMACLKERTRDLGLQIWVVDHRMPPGAAFDSVIRVVKSMKGVEVGLIS